MVPWRTRVKHPGDRKWQQHWAEEHAFHFWFWSLENKLMRSGLARPFVVFWGGGCKVKSMALPQGNCCGKGGRQSCRRVTSLLCEWSLERRILTWWVLSAT